MPYYLSRANETFIAPYIERMIACTDTLKLESPSPARLAYILRNALKTKWKMLDGEFLISEKDTYVLIKRKIPLVADDRQVVVTKSVFDIANDILSLSPFPTTRYSLIDELDSVKALAESKGLKVEITPNYFTISQS